MRKAKQEKGEKHSVEVLHAHHMSQCLKIIQNVAFDIFEFWHFLVILKLTCLVTLFDRKLQVFKNWPKSTNFGIFNELLYIQSENEARFACNFECDF